MRSAGEVVGVVLMVVGVIVLFGTVGADAGLADVLGWLWPLLIVGFGLWLLWDAGNRRRSEPRAGWSAWGPNVSPQTTGAWGPGAGPLPGPDAGRSTPGGPDREGWGGAARARGLGVLHDRRFLGEIEIAGPMQAGPMRIETFIGEVRLDLTQATFPDGETPIHVSTAIGEVRVLLPADVPASVRASSVLGESEALGRVSGAFMGDARVETDDYAGATRRIRLEARSLIGEVAVRRARSAAGTDPLPPPVAAQPPVAPQRPTQPPAAPGDPDWPAEPPAASAAPDWPSEPPAEPAS